MTKQESLNRIQEHLAYLKSSLNDVKDVAKSSIKSRVHIHVDVIKYTTRVRQLKRTLA